MTLKLIAAAALLVTGLAHAATPGPLVFDADGNTQFGNTPVNVLGSFTDEWSFTVPNPITLTSGSITTNILGTGSNKKDVDFSAVYLAASSGGAPVYSFSQTGTDPSEQWSLNDVTLSGTWFLVLKGAQIGPKNGGYGAELTTAAAVPEPETYALMLAGLGAVGFMARRRRVATAA